MKFEIEIYEKANGNIPFDDFMQSLPKKLQYKVLRDIDLLESYGSTLREPFSKYLDDGIFELRTRHASNITRTLYFFCDGNTIVITHGFIKKSQKSPVNEINKAKLYRDDWLRRKKDAIC